MLLYSLEEYFHQGVYVGFGIAALAFVASLFVSSPYGRFASASYGVEMDPRIGWFLMEIMATVSFIYFYIQGPNANHPVPMIFAGLFLIHYANRGFYFPFNIRVHNGAKTSFSWLVVASGVLVTSLHGYLNAQWYSRFAEFLDWEWLSSPTCIAGLVIYEVGFWATIRCEYIMRHLRDGDGDSAPIVRYKIPQGFLFEYITSPQYFTELVAFFGWAVMTWSPAGAVIFCISFANLVPRAVQSQAWYRQKFDNYPPERKILIPFVW
jgi:3-oxo-5-alpha-steroid 4-dehydrogenase 1